MFVRWRRDSDVTIGRVFREGFEMRMGVSKM